MAILRRDGAPADPALARAALEAQRARGPEARRVWSEGPAAIGHGLLATTPEDDLAPQPFSAAGGAVVVALDGRLDNTAELAEATGLRESGTSDVELVAAAYAKWGATFAHRLLGDFAIVLWDARRREMLCARDPLASRPLYVRADHRVVLCASEPRALFRAAARATGAIAPTGAGSATGTGEIAEAGDARQPRFDAEAGDARQPRFDAEAGDAPQASFDAMALLLAERYVERRFTLIRGVEAILPGGTLVLSADRGDARTIPPSWPGPLHASPLRSAGEHEEALRATLREAVRARLRAKGRVAIHVSGGLDSSAVAALAVEITRARGEAPPLLVRCVFPGLSCDESEMSQAVADHLGLPIESVEMPGDLADFAPDPRPDRPWENPIAMMLVRMSARTNALGARVTLTGAGSDQLLFPTGLEIQGALLRGDARRALDLAGILVSPLDPAAYARLLRDGVGRALPTPVRRAIRRLRGKDDGLPAWMTEAARGAVRRSEEAAAASRRHLGFPGPAAAPSTRRLGSPSPAARQLVMRIAGDADYAYSMVLADRIAGASSADMRHPFFDRRVIDLLLSFLDDVRSAGPPPKALLRRAMGTALPEVVRERRSAAEFSVLVRRALVLPYGERLAAIVRDGRLTGAGLIDGPRAAEAILRARTDDATIREVMMLASLEMWLRSLDP